MLTVGMGGLTVAGGVGLTMLFLPAESLWFGRKRQVPAEGGATSAGGAPPSPPPPPKRVARAEYSLERLQNAGSRAAEAASRGMRSRGEATVKNMYALECRCHLFCLSFKKCIVCL